MNKFQKVLSFIAIVLIGASVFSSIGRAEEANSLQMWYKISTHAYKDNSGWNTANLKPLTSILSFTTSSSTQNANGLYIKPDGTSFYYSDYYNDKVYQYNMSTPFDITTATLYGSFSVSSQSTQNTSIYFSADGTSMYVLNYATYVYQYTLSTAWDVTTATYASKSFNVATATGSYLQGLAFNADGTSMYTIGTNSKTVVQYTLSTAWDVSTAVAAGKTFSVSSQQSQPYGVDFNADGTKMYIVGYSSAYVHEYTLSTAWDVSTATYASILFSTSAWSTYPGEARIANSGNYLYILDYYQDKLIQYSLATAEDISTASLTKDKNYLYSDTTTYGPLRITFNDTGLKMYLYNTSNYRIYPFTLTTAYDSSTATYDGSYKSLSYASGDAFYTADGLHIYTYHRTDNTVYQWNCTTAYDVSTCSRSSNSKLVSSQQSYGYSVTLSTDGTKMYVSGSTPIAVHQYTLSTAWDLSTATYDDKVFTPSTSGTSITFKPTGQKMYLYSSGVIYQYTLSTAWDVTTAVLDTSTLIGGWDCSNYSITCSSGFGTNYNGSILYVAGSSRKYIWQFEMGK